MRPVVVYTQRVDVIEAYGERRDSADQRIGAFLYACGYLPLSLPNSIEIAQALIDEYEPKGIVLTGGNNLCKYRGNAPERDKLEHWLIEFALHKGVPILGFCRGMQMILDYFENLLISVSKHIAVRHVITGQMGARKVNSYHSMAAIEVKRPLQVLAKADDGVIEAIKHESEKIVGIMWHPERNISYDILDIHMVRNLFAK